MKAIRIHTFGDPEVMQLEEIPDLQPDADQVVVRVHAVGINPVETYIRSGIYPKPPTPFTPGNDGAGVIEAIGSVGHHWEESEPCLLSPFIMYWICRGPKPNKPWKRCASP